MSANDVTDSKHISFRGELALLSLVLLCGLSVRVYLAAAAPTVSRDTCTFVWFARDLCAQGLGAVREYDQHPLYSLSVAATHAALDRAGLAAAGHAGWERAAVVASCTAGLGCILLIWALTRHLFGARLALVAALFAAVLPELARYSADGLSDPLHLLLYLSALLLGATAVSRGSWRRALGAGLCAGLAFVTRPEGAATVLVLVPACLFATTRPRWRTRLLLTGMVALAFALPAAPYVLATGKLIQKKPIEKLFPWLHEPDPHANFGVEHPAPDKRVVLAGALAPDGSVPRRAAEAIVLIVRQWLRMCRVVYFLLAVVGVAACRWPRSRHAACGIITAAGLLHFAVLVLLVVNFDYADKLSKRHTLILAALILPWAAAGAEWIVVKISQRVHQAGQRQRPQSGPPSAGLWAVVLLCVIGPTGYWLLRPLHPGGRDLLLMGEWLAANRPDAAMVMTTEPRIAFYADKTAQRWPAESGRLDELIAHLDRFKPSILALDVRRVTRSNPAFLDELEQSAEARRRLRRIPPVLAETGDEKTPGLILFDVIVPGRVQLGSQGSS